MKIVKTAKVTSLRLTKRKYEKIVEALKCFKVSVNFLIENCVENPIFEKLSKKGSVYYNYSSYPKIRKSFYYAWKSKFPSFHTHYCHSSARITKDVLKSWNSWCFKKRKRLPNPIYKKDSMRLEECLCFLEGNYLVLVVEPRSKIYMPFRPNEHFNVLKTEKCGEITIKLRNDRKVDIFVPFISEVQAKPYESVMGIDVNERSVDLLIISEKNARFQSLDSSQLSTTHFAYSLKRKNIAKNIDTSELYQPTKRRKLLSKYGKKERGRVKPLVHALANKVVNIANEYNSLIIVENLRNIRQSNSRQKNLKPWQQKKSKKLRRRLNRWNFKQFQNYASYKANSTGHLVEYIDPKNTSKKCLNCGKCSRCSSFIFVCKHCGFTVNRHFQATANIIEHFLESQNVASSGPAEGRQMKPMVGELRKFKESIVRDTSQCGKMIQNYSLLST